MENMATNRKFLYLYVLMVLMVTGVYQPYLVRSMVQ